MANTTGEQDATGFSVEERAAMKSAAAEKRAAASRSKAADRAAAEAQDLADSIAKMTDADRALAERVAALVAAAAPDLAPKTWYGMPAWALDGKTVLFFKNAAKFKERYSTIGFTDAAALDDGVLWPKEFAVVEIGDAEAARITDLVRRAVARG